MGELVNQENFLEQKSIVKRVREINDHYFIIETDKTTFLTNGKDVYDIKNYKNVKKVLFFNNELYMFTYKDFTGTLIKVDNLEVLFHEFDIYDVVFSIASPNILILLSSGDSSLLYNFQEKRFICKDLKYHFLYIIADNLFIYEDLKPDKDDNKCNYLFNDQGEKLLDCGSRIPYFMDGNLVMQVNKEIHIYHDFLGENNKQTILAKGSSIIAKPQIYHDNFVIVVDGFVKIINANLEEIKLIPYNTDNEITDTTVEKDYLLMKVKVNDTFKTVAVSLVNDFIVEHDFMDVLPYWEEEKRRTIVAYDKVIDNNKDSNLVRPREYIYTLYDEEGNKLFSSSERFTDVDDLSTDKNNLFKFTSRESTKVLNIDTLEFRQVPWVNIHFNEDGYAFCFNDETELCDVIDQDLNVCFSGINLNKINIRNYTSSFFFLLNNLVCLVDNLPYNQTRFVILDEEGNVYLDSIDCSVNTVGNYIEVIEDGEIKYINSITKTTTENSIPALPMNAEKNVSEIILNKKLV